MATAAKIPIMTMITINSMSVNPFWFLNTSVFVSVFGALLLGFKKPGPNDGSNLKGTIKKYTPPRILFLNRKKGNRDRKNSGMFD
jgi:hypothetical protein